MMREYLEEYREAVRLAILENHEKGLPVYQCKEDYIVAIYPGGKEVKLQKVHREFSSEANA